MDLPGTDDAELIDANAINAYHISTLWLDLSRELNNRVQPAVRQFINYTRLFKKHSHEYL